MKNTQLYRFVKWLVYLGIGILIVAGLINVYIRWYAKPYRLQSGDDVAAAQAVLILGAGVYRSGELSPMLEDRVRMGWKLYRDKRVKKILVSGDHGQMNYDEVGAVRKYLLKLGVKPQDLFTDHAGFDTYSSFYRARDVFKVKSLIISTQSFHLSRAVYLARRQGLEAVGIVADKQTYRTIRLAQFREVFAQLKAFWEAEILKPEPKYLGKPYPITGDGRETW
jgi:vancomycin permeability regulator SanA